MTETPSTLEVTRILKARMAAAALIHAEKVDLRTGVMLERAGLLKREAESESDAELIQILSDTNHPRRKSTYPGPIVFYSDLNSQKNRYAVDVRQLFLSSNAKLRQAACKYFIPNPEDILSIELTPTTRLTLETNQELIGNSDPAIWQDLALQLHDVIEDDLFIQLSGVRQSIGEQYDDGLKYYLSKALAPNLRSFESLGPTVLRPSAHTAELAKLFDSILKIEKIELACDEYLSVIGLLPRRDNFSFGRMLKEWSRIHAKSKICPKVLLQWATSSKNPLARFYVALALLEIDGTREASESKFIADVMIDMLANSGDAGLGNSDEIYWKLSFNLARHFQRHLETLTPGGNGEALAMAGWWLSFRLSLVLCEFPDHLSHLDEVALQPQMNNVESAWHFSNPAIESSSVSDATHWRSSLWSIAAMAMFSYGGEHSLSVLSLMKNRTEFERKLCQRAMVGCATPIEDGTEGLYLFELNYPQFVERLGTIVQDLDSQRLLDVTSKLYKGLVNSESFGEIFLTLKNCDEIEQFLIVNVAHILSLRNRLPLDVVWDRLIDSEWRSKTFERLSTAALEILFLSFARSVQRRDGKWLAGLPHIYAQAAEEQISDDEKSKFLFSLTMFSSIHTHSVSAVERLLRGSSRSKFLEHGRWWKETLAQSRRNCPPWVSARIRALSAAISASQ